MPNYDYKCDSCGYVQEVTHSIAGDYNGEECWTSCCGECPGKMKRMFSPTPHIIRGQTEYKPKGK